MKRVGILTMCKISFMYICIYRYICVCAFLCFAFVGPDNKLYKMHGKYIKISIERFLFS